MTITAKYLDEKHEFIEVTLNPGDSLGEFFVLSEVLNSNGTVASPAGSPLILNIGNNPLNPEFKAFFPDSTVLPDGNVNRGTPIVPIEEWVDPFADSVPYSIPMYRAKIILSTTTMPENSNITIMKAANDFIESIEDPITKLVASTAFNDAPDLFRNSITLATVVENLHLEQEFVDSLFIKAMKLPV